jgi:hypothetical protein
MATLLYATALKKSSGLLAGLPYEDIFCLHTGAALQHRFAYLDTVIQYRKFNGFRSRSILILVRFERNQGALYLERSSTTYCLSTAYRIS